MRIRCPYCGERSVDEFVAMGPADLVRPAVDAPTDAFVAYVYERENPRGTHRELYYHAYGCHAWLAVSRDTLLHDVRAAEAMMLTEAQGETP